MQLIGVEDFGSFYTPFRSRRSFDGLPSSLHVSYKDVWRVLLGFRGVQPKARTILELYFTRTFGGELTFFLLGRHVTFNTDEPCHINGFRVSYDIGLTNQDGVYCRLTSVSDLWRKLCLLGVRVSVAGTATPGVGMGLQNSARNFQSLYSQKPTTYK